MSQNMQQMRPQTVPITEDRIKEIIMETLIELNFIAQPQRKKVLPQ